MISASGSNTFQVNVSPKALKIRNAFAEKGSFEVFVGSTSVFATLFNCVYGAYRFASTLCLLLREILTTGHGRLAENEVAVYQNKNSA